MRIELKKTSQTIELGGRTIVIGPVKAKYMIAAQRVGGAGAGTVELGFRTIANLLKECNGPDSFTYDELIDLPLADTQPLLDLLNDEQ